jgi:tetratricopeptide (TPR) repeat protein
MRVMSTLALILAGLAVTPQVRAQTVAVCPAPADRAAEKAPLLRQLRMARDATDAQIITGQLWQIWTAAPDTVAQDLLDRGMTLIRAGDQPGARQLLDELVAYCPDWAEGWNQRAYAAFLMQDYAAALPDLDRALAIDPEHVPALSGRALTLFGLGRADEARQTLRAAVAMNPWLGERVLLQGGAAGTDI